MNLNIQNWKMFFLKDLYNIKMGNGFDKCKMSEDFPEVNFVSRVSYNNGVDTIVDRVDNTEPFSKGLLTVALGGSYLGSCFVQEAPFYTGQNVAVMTPICEEMTHSVNLFISTLVRFECKTKYYAFGRELNTHINRDFSICLPVKHNEDGTIYVDKSLGFSEEGYVPDWNFIENLTQSIKHKPISTLNQEDSCLDIDTDNWKDFVFNKVFKLVGGFYNKKPEHSTDGDFPFLGSTDSNNGVTEYYSLEDIQSWSKTGEMEDTLEKKIFEGNCIAVTVNGSVCNAYYQRDKFTCSHDITAFYLKHDEMNVYLAMFLCTIINNEKYRWSYGRKPHDVKKFGKSIVKLPVKCDDKGKPIIDSKKVYSDEGYIPDWEYMENFIKSLPFGDRIK